MPRSGTTWVARLLATARGTALAGREPMNPRGRQYALAGTLRGWSRLQEPSARQVRALWTSYRGLNPLVYSRYGRRQWAAPLPWTRLIVKDPFAMLSLPTMVHSTRTVPVLVYRHPAAALASYQRMGWKPDLVELRPLVQAYLADFPDGGLSVDELPLPGEVGEPEAMGRFWNALYAIALNDVLGCPGAVVVSHEELAGGGVNAAMMLFTALGLGWTDRSAVELAGASGEGAGEAKSSSELHNFDRDPRDVATSWRLALPGDAVDAIEAVTLDVRGRLDEVRLRLSG